MSEKISAVVLISGSGSNLQAIIDAIDNNALALKIELVISNKAAVKGLKRAETAGIATQILEATQYKNREGYDFALANAINKTGAQLIILAGFMRILSDTFVNQYLGRLINIHPSLLPDFRGLHTHQRVLEAKRRVHGASVHFVTPDLDAGPVIAQARIDVIEGDTVTSLATRVLKIEHKLYPLALNLIAQNRITMRKHILRLDGERMEQPLQYSSVRHELYVNNE